MRTLDPVTPLIGGVHRSSSVARRLEGTGHWPARGRREDGGWTLEHDQLSIRTRRFVQFFDLTSRLDHLVARSGITCGMLTVQTRHTTTGVAINEHEPLLLADLKATLERLAPARAPYRHDDMRRRRNVGPLEPRNGHAHCKALALRASETVHIVDGRLLLGRWQRVFLIELDGPRNRDVSVLLVGMTA